jgi:hypothetical protein
MKKDEGFIKLLKEKKIKFELKELDNRYVVTFIGQSAHGSVPWMGVNAGLIALDMLGQYYKNDELLHAYGTNYDYKKDQLSKEKNNGKNIKNEERKYLRNNALKNNINSKNIYTDEQTNQMRKTFKRKLTHHNAYKNVEQDEIGQKNFHKIKTNKAKIKRFKTKNENEYDDNESNVSKKSGNKKPHGNKAKIRKFPNNERNIINDYEYNNIVLQNSTYNQTTFNYYANDKPSRLNTNHTINHSKNKFSAERQNKSVKISGNRIMAKKIKK